MRVGLIISVLVHSMLLLALVLKLPDPTQFETPKEDSIPVELVTIEEVSKKTSTAKEPPEKKPEVEKPAPVKVEKKIEKFRDTPQPKPENKQVKPAPAPAPQPAPQPEDLANLIKELEPPKPEPEPEPKVEPEPKPEAEAKPENARPVPRPRAKPRIIKQLAAKHKKELDLDNISALLNKIEDKRQPPPPAEEAGTPEIAEKAFTGSDERLAATMLDWFRQRVGQCWSIPAGVRGGEKLVVRVQIELDAGGNVVGQPNVINSSGHPAFNAAARSAVAAVLGCQPYDRLPAEKHAMWRVIRMNFDPSVMLRVN